MVLGEDQTTVEINVLDDYRDGGEVELHDPLYFTRNGESPFHKEYFIS